MERNQGMIMQERKKVGILIIDDANDMLDKQ